MLSYLKAQSFGSINVRAPLSAPGQRIGLMGGSFNPPHRAHLAISEGALKRLGLDQVWWLVSPGNPLKSHADLAPLDQRLAQCRALATDPRIKITALEADLGSPFTAVTVAFLTRRFPAVSFVWIMGGDNLAGFHRWRHWRDIAFSVPMAVADRPGWRERALASPVARTLARYRVDERQAAKLARMPPPAWTYLSLRLLPDSSTALRTGQG
jgi:nicotinate-nucleotide adenylyltransferase